MSRWYSGLPIHSVALLVDSGYARDRTLRPDELERRAVAIAEVEGVGAAVDAVGHGAVHG